MLLRKFRVEFAGEMPSGGSFLGELVHGWVFRVLAEADADMATRWHDAITKPFAMTVHCGTGRRGSADRMSVELAALTIEAAKVFQGLAGRIGDAFHLGRQDVRVTSVVPGEPQLYSDVLERAFHSERKRIDIELVSPTSFRDHGIQTVFPTPDLVFASLYRRWSELAAVPLPPVTEWNRLLGVSQFRLESRITSFRQYKLIGAIGSVRYQLLQDDAEYRALVTALCLFANWAGIGYKTTMGLGNVKFEV